MAGFVGKRCAIAGHQAIALVPQSGRETVMTSNPTSRCFRYALSAALASGSAAAWATDAVKPDAAKPDAAPIVLAQAGEPSTTMGVPDSAREALGFNPIERGVRNAATQGATALRRYVQRTEPIYHFSYRDFARLLPTE
jgi:hypothetical protein